MLKYFASLVVLLAWLDGANASVLIVADEFPAMEVLAKRLQSEAGLTSVLVDQANLPAAMTNFTAVIVYIHLRLDEKAERAFIQYAEQGGRLVLLHHSISSGKRQNRDWFRFLGVDLPPGDVGSGGYKWIEGVSVEWVNLAPAHPFMTNGISYPRTTTFKASADVELPSRPSYELKETEVYLNHVLSGERQRLMGLKFLDDKTGKIWMQDTAGWVKRAKQGWVLYFMPGHTQHDFENAIYGRIVVNAVSATLPE